MSLELLARIRQERIRRTVGADRDETLERCKRLAGFVREAWPILEPIDLYIHGWHIDAMSEHLEAVSRGEITRLCINVPTGTMKSLLVSVFYQAWEWGPLERAHLRYLSTSHREDFAKRDTRRTRTLVTSGWYRSLYPHVNLIRSAELSFENDKTGWREGMPFDSLTGARGHRVLIDDPHSTKTAESEKERENAVRTFRESVHSRVVDPKTSAIILIMQRLHMQDVAAIALEYGYEHLMLPMEFEPERRCYTIVRNDQKPLVGRYNAKKQIWLPADSVRRDDNDQFGPVKTVYPQDHRTRSGELLFEARFPRATVEKDKAMMGSYAHAGQNQQRPAPREGGMFKRHWFRIIDVAPLVYSIVRCWDLAASEVTSTMTDPDWTAGVKIGRTREGMFIILDVERFRDGPHLTRERILTVASQDRVENRNIRIVVPQDPGQAGKFQAQDLVRYLAGYNIRAVKQSGSKEMRAEPFAAQCEAGNVCLIRARWNEPFIDEMCNFPSGHDDQVDAASGAFEELVSRGEICVGALKGTI